MWGFVLKLHNDHSLCDRSLRGTTWYTGIAKDPVARLREHNAGKNRFTKGHRSWKIIHTEQHFNWIEVRVREKYSKQNNSLIFIQFFFICQAQKFLALLFYYDKVEIFLFNFIGHKDS